MFSGQKSPVKKAENHTQEKKLGFFFLILHLELTLVLLTAISSIYHKYISIYVYDNKIFCCIILILTKSKAISSNIEKIRKKGRCSRSGDVPYVHINFGRKGKKGKFCKKTLPRSLADIKKSIFQKVTFLAFFLNN